MKRAQAVTALLGAAVLLTGCFTSPHEAVASLESQGMTNVRTGGAAWFACGKNDKTGIEFTATNPLGRPVAGVVCCGVLKGCTVRW